MHLTTLLPRLHKARPAKAGAGAPDGIEITPAMIEAGAMVLMVHDHELSPTVAEIYVEEVIRAALRARA